MKTILTGIRVNGEMTLGNFLGAMLPMVRMANKYSVAEKPEATETTSQTDVETATNQTDPKQPRAAMHVNIFVPDLHTIISDIDGELQKNLVRSLKCYLAAGLEVNKNVHIYRQSHIPAHSELCWILNCFTQVGEAKRMTQYKEKGEGKDSVNVGIFDYPILMAADILLYSAQYVPVGEDQFQHLELTRTIAHRFNHRFNQEIFVLPVKPSEQAKFMGLENGLRIRDLQNPTKKMSKSTHAENSKIMMSDNPERAAKKIMSATTDSLGKIQFDMFNQPGISNLLQIEALVTGVPLQEVITTWAGESSYGDLKRKVAESVRVYLTDFQTKLAKVDDVEIMKLLKTGEAYASQVANAKLLEVQKAVGLR